jgi:Phosphoribosylglycinamide synthetase, ATP-grasp (A) domain
VGPEISVLALSDGYSIIPLPAAQDHKRIGDGDVGPNTGGMGAYAPAPVATSVMNRINTKVLRPTIDGMRKEGQLCAVMFLFHGLTPRCVRLSFCRSSFHRFHANGVGSQGSRIQCEIRRPRNGGSHAPARTRCGFGCRLHGGHHLSQCSAASPTRISRPVSNIAWIRLILASALVMQSP